MTNNDAGGYAILIIGVAPWAYAVTRDSFREWDRWRVAGFTGRVKMICAFASIAALMILAVKYFANDLNPKYADERCFGPPIGCVD